MVPNIKKRILVAVCGGIAAYKSAEIVRLLKKRGMEVRVVMTHSAMEFITPLTFQALTGHPVHTELLDVEQENAMGHINLARWADSILVAPATANMIAKFSLGLADDLLSTLYLAALCPIFIAPAMNQAMWSKSATRQNIERLRSNGNIILGPDQGEQACGETGQGRMMEPPQICQSMLGENELLFLQGRTILISAGPTREPIDPVRYLTNRSSGKMGYALARAAVDAGARVTLISGPVTLREPSLVDVVQVETALEMFQAVTDRASDHDIYIGAAAISDYTPATMNSEKIKKNTNELSIELCKTRDVLATVATLEFRPFTVGFAAETHNLEVYARSKLKNKKLDMIAANWVGRENGGFDSELNALQVYWPEGQQDLKMQTKDSLAMKLLQLIAERFDEKGTA